MSLSKMQISNLMSDNYNIKYNCRQTQSMNNTLCLQKQIQSILKQGFLDKQSRFLKAWRSRWFVLTSNALFTFKQRKVYNKPTQTILLRSMISIKSSDGQIPKQFTFRIDTNQDTFYIAASSNSEKQQWIGQIGKAKVKIDNKLQQ